jgi:hypothetical protein
MSFHPGDLRTLVMLGEGCNHALDFLGPPLSYPAPVCPARAIALAESECIIIGRQGEVRNHFKTSAISASAWCRTHPFTPMHALIEYGSCGSLQRCECLSNINNSGINGGEGVLIID